MNYRDFSINYLKECKTEGIVNYREEEKSTEALEKAFDLSIAILENRFSNELKQYNNDETKAYDEFIYKKNLDYLRIFVEEFLLLDKKEEELDFYKAVRHHMRSILSTLYIIEQL